MGDLSYDASILVLVVKVQEDHAIAWTHELFRDVGRAACQSLVDLAQGRRPKGVVNPEIFEQPSFQQKWKRLQLN